MSKKIGKYTYIDKIKKGGFGICYKAKDDQNKMCAVKKTEKEKESRESLINEINLLKVLKSKHCVELIESIEDEDYFYIVMELCDGDLYNLIKKKGKLNIILIIKIIYQLNEILKLMNKKSIEHRDLKPENILIKYNNEQDFDIKLTDFGFAKCYGSNSKFTSVIGTEYYMAPEVYEQKGNSKSDLWSIGLILYFLYFNKIPFNNFKEYLSENSNIILEKSNFEPFDDLISKLLVKDFKQRISWNDYFYHPFNNLQIIEIYIDIEKNNTNSKIFNENFKIEQLKNSIMFIDEKNVNFVTNYLFNKGKHKIIIIFNNDLTNCSNMFNECKEIIEIKFINLKTDKVTNMSYMFNECSNLKNLDINSFNTENVINMSHMFCKCSNLNNLNVKNFITKKVNDMSFMFYECSNLNDLDVTNFDTKNVINMSNMFCKCSNLKNLNINKFDTSNVINMSNMFQSCSNLNDLNVNNFITNKVTDMSFMFSECSNLNTLDVSNFNTENVINMRTMFQECSKLNYLNITNFNTNNVIDMSFMFSNCQNLNNLDIISFNIENIKLCMYMFYNCPIINYEDKIKNFKKFKNIY